MTVAGGGGARFTTRGRVRGPRGGRGVPRRAASRALMMSSLPSGEGHKTPLTVATALEPRMRAACPAARTAARATVPPFGRNVPRSSRSKSVSGALRSSRSKSGFTVGGREAPGVCGRFSRSPSRSPPVGGGTGAIGGVVIGGSGRIGGSGEMIGGGVIGNVGVGADGPVPGNVGRVGSGVGVGVGVGT